MTVGKAFPCTIFQISESWMTTLLEAQQDRVRSPGVPFLKSLLAIPWILLLAFGKQYTCAYPAHIPSSPRGSLGQLVPLLAPFILPSLHLFSLTPVSRRAVWHCQCS